MSLGLGISIGFVPSLVSSLSQKFMLSSLQLNLSPECPTMVPWTNTSLRGGVLLIGTGVALLGGLLGSSAESYFLQ